MARSSGTGAGQLSDGGASNNSSVRNKKNDESYCSGPTFKLVSALGDTKTDRMEQDIISAMTFDKEGKFLSVGDNDGRIVVFTIKDDEKENGMPQLQFFEEIFAFDYEFNSQKSIDISAKVTALEWVNRGYNGCRPSFLAANEKSIKLI